MALGRFGSETERPPKQFGGGGIPGIGILDSELAEKSRKLLLAGIEASLAYIFATGSFSRDINTSGNQSVTGIGFKPNVLVIQGCVDDADKTGFGIAVQGAIASGDPDALIVSGMSTKDQVNVNTWETMVTADNLFKLYNSSANSTVCALVSMDADGFTLSWTLNGTGATGTFRGVYLAYGPGA